MDIFSMFRQGSQTQNQPAEQQQQNNQNQNQNQNQQQGNPGNIPNGAGVDNTPPGAKPDNTNNNQNQNDSNKGEKSPLDAFSDLWKNDTNSSQQQDSGQLFNVDPQKLMEAAGKVDFTKVIKPEQLQAIAKGGEEGIQAFAQALNTVSQTVYAQSALASTKIVEQALKKSKESWEAGIPSLIKKYQVGDSARSKNPALSHPAVQPLVEGIQSQLQTKFPNATTAEIEQMTEQYFEHVYGVFSGNKKDTNSQNATKNKRGEQDWSAFLGIDS